MTARHVVKGGCNFRIALGGRSYTAGHLAYWYTTGRRDLVAADVATLKLDRPAPGYVFSFARRTPRIKTTIAVVGFPLGNPLSFNQGPLVFAQRVNGVPSLGVRLATAKGASGSAFLDPAANVVGILQAGIVAGPGDGTTVTPDDGVFWGLNLVRWWGPGIVRDLCRAYPQGGIPGCGRASAPNCSASDRRYLDKLTGPWSRFVDRWNAWLDRGQPLNESFRPTLDALEKLWINNPSDLACSSGVRRASGLVDALGPSITHTQEIMDALALIPVDDPGRSAAEATLDAAISRLDAATDRLERQLERVGFFR
jgi:hypothetical protein